MNIRGARVDDAGAIARLHVASWQATYRNELPVEFLEAQDVARWIEGWRTRLAEAATIVLIAEDAGSVVGFVACGPARDGDADPARVFEIYNLHAAPGSHGLGIGTALFAAALEAATRASASDLSLWVVETNVPARRFYERKGMQSDGARQAHALAPGASLDEVRYRKGLSP